MKTSKLSRKALVAIIVSAAVLLLLGILAVTVFFVNIWSVTVTPNEAGYTTLEWGESYTEPGAEARLYGSIFLPKGKSLPVVTSGEVDGMTLGEYTVTYSAESFWASGSAERHVTVVDTVAPEITLKVIPGQSTHFGDEYKEEGYTATDNHDGDITDKVERTVGEGVIRYAVSDSSGNRYECSRAIKYENDPPILTLYGDEIVYLTASTYPYIEPGWEASDEYDGDLSETVVREGYVNPYSAGSYTLTYTVTDSGGLTTSRERTVIVSAAGQPDMVIRRGVIYLTFDDGPSIYTPKLLDVLDRYDVKATFFVTNGQSDYIYLLGDIAARGHSIGVHTASHVYDAIYESEEAYFNDYQTMLDIIQEQTGLTTTLMRFPGGSSNTVSCFNPGIMTRLAQDVTDMGLQYFDWNVSSGDTDSKATRETVVENVIDGISEMNCAVVLQHDIRSFSVDAVEEIILWGLENGYTFLPLDPTSYNAHHGIAN